MSKETLALDPIEFAPNRTELALDELGLRVEEKGVDWGESQVAVQLAQRRDGAVVTDRQLEPVEMTIPLIAAEDGGMPVAEALHRLQQKVGIFQANERETSWVRRDFDDGVGTAGAVGYKVLSATLHGVQGRSLGTGVTSEIELKLLRSPLCYATEEVESAVFTEDGGRVLAWELAEILGTAPGLIRFRIDNLNADAPWRGLIIPIESRDHPQDATADTTAALTYEAEDLTLSAGAEVATRAGASGGKVVRHPGLTAGWLTVLSSPIKDLGHMSHVGAREPWMRIFDPGEVAGGVELRLQYRPLGALGWTDTRRTVATPIVDDFALVDLGECRPEQAVLGEQRWEWRLQARAPSGAGTIEIDQVHVCPTEQYAVVRAPESEIAADQVEEQEAGSVASDATAGEHPWSDPENAKVSDGNYAVAEPGLSFNETSEYLLADDFGFGLPEGSEVVAVAATMERHQNSAFQKLEIRDEAVHLVVGGVIQDGYNAAKPDLWPEEVDGTVVYDEGLWGLSSISAGDANAADFGVALRVKFATDTGIEARVNRIAMTVYFTEAEDENRICFAERSIEVRSDGTYRQLPDDDVWGAIVIEGFDPVAPPSWLEGRSVRGVVIPSQGDLELLADSGENAMALQVFHRPAYHFAREATA